MKTRHLACLIGLLPTLAFAQTPPPGSAAPTDKPFQPVLARDHMGAGRIGALIAIDKATGLPKIVALTRGGPAVDYGFMIGDVILRIDKNLTSTLTEDEIHLALRGEPGTGVELTVMRNDDPNYIVRAIERRVLPADAEEMIKPPRNGVWKE